MRSNAGNAKQTEVRSPELFGRSVGRSLKCGLSILHQTDAIMPVYWWMYYFEPPQVPGTCDIIQSVDRLQENFVHPEAGYPDLELRGSPWPFR